MVASATRRRKMHTSACMVGTAGGRSGDLTARTLSWRPARRGIRCGCMAIPTPVQSRECAFVSAQVCIEGLAEAEAAAHLAADKILALVADIRTIPCVDVIVTRSGHDAPAEAFHDAVSNKLLTHMRAPVRDALAQLTRTCYAHGWHDLTVGDPALHPALPFMVDRLETSTPAELVVLLRRAQAERDRLVAENLNLEAQLTRATNALHASRAQRDDLVAAYAGLIAGIRVDCARAASKTATTTTE